MNKIYTFNYKDFHHSKFDHWQAFTNSKDGKDIVWAIGDTEEGALNKLRTKKL